MNLNLHATGASFVAGKSEANPRDLVIDSIKMVPGGTRKEVFDRFRSLLAECGDEYQRAVDWYFFVNMHTYLTTSRNHHQDPVERANAAASQRAAVEAIKAQIIMLDLTMPNGKAMRDCTGAEMAKFGNRFQRIAEKVGKGKTVGSVLNEDQVKAIMK